MMFSRRLGGLACLLLAAIILQVTSPAAADPGSDAWDPSLPRVTSAGAPGDPWLSRTRPCGPPPRPPRQQWTSAVRFFIAWGWEALGLR